MVPPSCAHCGLNREFARAGSSAIVRAESAVVLSLRRVHERKGKVLSAPHMHHLFVYKT